MAPPVTSREPWGSPQRRRAGGRRGSPPGADPAGVCAASARTRRQRGKGAAGPAPRGPRFGANLQFRALAAAVSMAPPRPQVSAARRAAGPCCCCRRCRREGGGCGACRRSRGSPGSCEPGQAGPSRAAEGWWGRAGGLFSLGTPEGMTWAQLHHSDSQPRVPAPPRCPCPPDWGRGLGLGVALGGGAGGPEPCAHGPRLAEGAGTGVGRDGTGGKERRGRRAGGPAACVRGGTILAAGGERRCRGRARGDRRVWSPWPARLAWAGLPRA